MILPHNKESVSTIADIFGRGGVVILPTDTIYGISGAVPISCERIKEIKGREETKPFIQLIASPNDIVKFTDVSVPAELLAFWPGPLSIIVPLVDGGTVAFRCPGDPWLREIIERIGTPIYSTSVNFSGKPACTKINDVISNFESFVDAIVDNGDCKNPVPSTIVSITGKKPVIIRQGAITDLENTGLF